MSFSVGFAADFQVGDPAAPCDKPERTGYAPGGNVRFHRLGGEREPFGRQAEAFWGGDRHVGGRERTSEKKENQCAHRGTIIAPVYAVRTFMNIFVCLKQTAARDSALRANAGGDWIDDADLSHEMNEPDAFALEEALRLKEAHGGEVIAVSAGPPRAASTIREALAKGADRGILIEDDALSRTDPLATARVLAAAIQKEPHDLVLTGLQSDDAGFGQTGVILAELLGVPHATIIMQVEVREGRLTVKRELEAGWFQRVEMPLPALLTIQSGINKVRYATLMGIKKAKTKPLTRYTPAELGVSLDPAQRIVKMYAPQKSKQTAFLQGSAQEQARQLVEKLRFEARVL